MMETKIPFLDVKEDYLELEQELKEAADRVFKKGWYVLGDEVTKVNAILGEQCIQFSLIPNKLHNEFNKIIEKLEDDTQDFKDTTNYKEWLKKTFFKSEKVEIQHTHKNTIIIKKDSFVGSGDPHREFSYSEKGTFNVLYYNKVENCLKEYSGTGIIFWNDTEKKCETIIFPIIERLVIVLRDK